MNTAREHANENLIKALTIDTFEILLQEKNKIERVSKMLLDQMDHLYYSPRTRKLRIIITPLLGELIQFDREKQNESVLLWLESKKESEFEWYLQRD